MRAIALRVRAEEAEAALDRLLALAPAGVYDRERGPLVELVVCGDADEGALAAACGPGLVSVAGLDVPDDLQERFAALVDTPVIAGRFVVRSPAAPPPAAGLVDIVIERGSAFGTGLHPTTQRCLELLLALEPEGSFADLGCGTGVLSIAAAKLGWSPVLAVDHDEGSVESARANAASNGVEVEARRVDLVAEPAPAADTVVANVPVFVQRAVRAGLERPPRALVVSGVTAAEADEVVASYAGLGLVERGRFVQSAWAAVLLAPPELELRPLPDAAERPVLRLPGDAGETRVEPAGPLPPLPGSLSGQLESRLPNGELALSSACALPPGARVAVLLAPGLFRLDVRHLEDTLKLSVRNLSGTLLRSLPDQGAPATVVTTSDLTIERPLATNARMRLVIGAGAEALEAAIVLSALSGTAASRIVAQAIVGPVLGAESRL